MTYGFNTQTTGAWLFPKSISVAKSAKRVKSATKNVSFTLGRDLRPTAGEQNSTTESKR